MHRRKIEAKVIRVLAGRDLVALFGQNNLVDDSGRRDIRRGQPRHVYTGETALKGLQEAHEVPHGKHMILHENSKSRDTIQQRIDLVTEQSLLCNSEIVISINAQLVLPFSLGRELDDYGSHVNSQPKP